MFTRAFSTELILIRSNMRFILHYKVYQMFAFLEVEDMIVNPKSSSIWRSILIKRQFILGTATDLFKMIPCRLFDEESRFKLIDFLVLKKVLIKGDWFCNAKGTLLNGYMKNSLVDPDLAVNLAEFGIDIEEYKRSLNPDWNDKRRIDGKIINQSCLFSNVLQERISGDQWFKDNLEIDDKYVHVTNRLLQTTSNYRKNQINANIEFISHSFSYFIEIDRFQQQQQKEKVQKRMANKRKKRKNCNRKLKSYVAQTSQSNVNENQRSTKTIVDFGLLSLSQCFLYRGLSFIHLCTVLFFLVLQVTHHSGLKALLIISNPFPKTFFVC